MENPNTFPHTMPKSRKPLNRKRPPKQPNNNWISWVIISIIILFIMMSNENTVPSLSKTKEITYTEFYTALMNNPTEKTIASAELVEGPETLVTGQFANGSKFKLNVPADDTDLLDAMRKNVPTFKVVPAQTFWSQLFFSFVPLLLLLFFIWFLSHRGNQMGNKIWSFGKSRARMNTSKEGQVTFKDVAGVDEAKEELQEVIEFLKDPKKFERLGGKIPKGVLLIGPPGTGKTLLARAVAGEADVPFFSLSGSDFVEMFVGVGASRVRDLFEQGRKAAKASGKGAIIFIDEIDAVGRQRFTGIGGGNDEREQTLNALLVEMDGFEAHSGLILIAATNRPDTLDPALLRPGRFDRQVVVGLPDINGREGILKVHTKGITLAAEIDLRKVARQTVYFSGADLANVCNEAALLAARKNKNAVDMTDMLAAVERVTMGPEKKSRVISKKEKEITAYHEAGHALLSLLIPEVDRFSKVSIIPRGMAGGYTLTPPTEDKNYLNKKELVGRMTVMLGGMVSEQIFTNDTSTGVSNDLENATRIARNMICVYGMSERMGPVSYGEHDHPGFLGRDIMQKRDYSDETAKNIDEEVRAIVEKAFSRAYELLQQNREKLDTIAQRLMEKEVIDIDEAYALLGMQPPASASNDDAPNSYA